MNSIREQLHEFLKENCDNGYGLDYADLHEQQQREIIEDLLQNLEDGQVRLKDILEPSLRADKLKQALNVITAAMRKANPGHCIRLQVDGSGSVRDQDDNEIIYFRNTDSLVKKYLNLAPKFEHWDLLKDQFNWIAKDSNGVWWAYDDKPTLESLGWGAPGDCRSLESLKIEIPCHWTNSLIKRPTSSGESH